MPARGLPASELADAVRNGAEKSNGPFVSGQLVTGTPGTRYCEGSGPRSGVRNEDTRLIWPNPFPWLMYSQNKMSLMMRGSRLKERDLNGTAARTPVG